LIIYQSKMLGFEVIGVVLGIWPVVLNNLALYKARKDGVFLLNELRTEELVFREALIRLSIESFESFESFLLTIIRHRVAYEASPLAAQSWWTRAGRRFLNRLTSGASAYYQCPAGGTKSGNLAPLLVSQYIT